MRASDRQLDGCTGKETKTATGTDVLTIRFLRYIFAAISKKVKNTLILLNGIGKAFIQEEVKDIDINDFLISVGFK